MDELHTKRGSGNISIQMIEQGELQETRHATGILKFNDTMITDRHRIYGRLRILSKPNNGTAEKNRTEYVEKFIACLWS